MRSLLLLVIPLLVKASKYSGHRVLRVTPSKPEHVTSLLEMHHEGTELDFWSHPTDVGRHVDIRVTPDQSKHFEAYLLEQGMQYYLMIEDVQDLIDHEALHSVSQDSQKHEGVQLLDVDDTDDLENSCHEKYETYSKIVKWMVDTADAYEYATLIELGESYEGRAIYGLEIDFHPDVEKPHFVVDGNIHAREWISGAVVRYIAQRFLTEYGKDDDLTRIADSISWTFIPVFNVDGYEFTHTSDRMWRKNRQPTSNSHCVGTDPCRNAAAGFGGPGSSNSSCSETYHGPHAFSAPCAKAVKDYVDGLDNVFGYINFHSYSQLFLMPYGYTRDRCEDYDEIMDISRAVVDAIKNTNGKNYTPGPASTTIYFASGIMNDYFFDAGVKYSFACELRDTGKYGFMLPADEICDTGDEILSGLVVLGDKIIDDWGGFAR